MRKLSHQELLHRQASAKDQQRIPLTVVLNNIRSLYNVGSIFRTADGAGIEKIWICGITGHPPNSQISKTALGAEETVPWEYREDVYSVITDLKRDGYEIVMLEQMEGSVDHADFHPAGKVGLVIGNEITGVSKDIVHQCDTAIEIEMAGLKNSLNVSVAFGIIAYQMRKIYKNRLTS